MTFSIVSLWFLNFCKKRKARKVWTITSIIEMLFSCNSHPKAKASLRLVYVAVMLDSPTDRKWQNLWSKINVYIVVGLPKLRDKQIKMWHKLVLGMLGSGNSRKSQTLCVVCRASGWCDVLSSVENTASYHSIESSYDNCIKTGNVR